MTYLHPITQAKYWEKNWFTIESETWKKEKEEKETQTQLKIKR